MITFVGGRREKIGLVLKMVYRKSKPKAGEDTVGVLDGGF
jgi:hypothetical protein